MIYTLYYYLYDNQFLYVKPDTRETEYFNSVPVGTYFQNDREARRIHITFDTFQFGPECVARGFQTLFIMIGGAGAGSSLNVIKTVG